VAPSYKMMDRATFVTFVEVFTQLGIWDWNRYNKEKRHAKLKNGAEYLFCSADDPQSLRGPNASGAWFDEMQNTDEEAYANVKACLRQHGKLGWMLATFTPGSPDHWTSRHFIADCLPTTILVDGPDGLCEVQYYRHPDKDLAMFRASLKENTFIDKAFYDDLCKDLASSPLRVRREIEGECVYLEGAEWDASYFENCEFDEWPDGGIRVLSLDSSKGKEGKTGDYSAFVKLQFVNGLFYLDADMRNDRDGNPHYFVVEEEMGEDLLIADMHRIADERKIVMPLTPMHTEKVKKEIRIRRWTSYISRRQLRFKANSPGAKLLKEQFMAFPMGDHDDGPDAAEYGLRMLVKATTGRVGQPRGYARTAMGGIIG